MGHVLRLPNSRDESQAAIRERLGRREGVEAHIRILLVQRDGEWLPMCGRIDICRSEDRPVVESTPRGEMRLLTETIPLNVLVSRLTSAFEGGPFEACGQGFKNHGMNSQWRGYQINEEWSEYGATWPIFHLFPDETTGHDTSIYLPIEADGPIGAYDGSDHCAQTVLGFLRTNPLGRDLRIAKFQIVEWDYRGMFHVDYSSGEMRLNVTPASDSNLSLSLVVQAGEEHAKTAAQPSELSVPIVGNLRMVSIALRHSGDIVCAYHWRAYYGASPMAGKGDEPHAPEPPLMADVLNFVKDPKLAKLIGRDLNELDMVATTYGMAKSALTLAGSILEALLIDVLSRNEAISKSLLPKPQKWPDRVSLQDLIGVASKIEIRLPGGKRPLLSVPTQKRAISINEHRDMIHPFAEQRAMCRIDDNAVYVMYGLLRSVMDDIRQNYNDGILTAFANGDVV